MEELPKYRAYSVPCTEIYYDPSFNCRGQFTMESIKHLAQDILSRNLEIPVSVQPASDVEGGLPVGFGYRLLAGHRRFKAVTAFLKWETIPAYIRSGLTERDAHVLNYAENLQRKDLNPLEEALGLSRLFPDGVSLRDAAAVVGRDTVWVHKRMKVLKLPEEVQEMVAARRVHLYDLEIILSKPTREAQIKAAEALAASKRGRGNRGNKTAELDGEVLARSFRRRRTKAEISDLITKLMNAGVVWIASRVAAWCAGYVSDDEISADIRQEMKSDPPAPS